ncbi:MAG: DUF4364 family protein [Clostridia bacterium]|nr:DUF4364 family protein [Clostridia bacterium]
MKRIEPPVEQRLLVLYALNALEGATDMQLLRFLTDTETTDYFTMKLALGDLENAGHVTRKHSLTGESYTITPEGGEALALFTARIPQSKRVRIDTGAPDWRKRLGMENQVAASAHALAGGGYQAELMIRDDKAFLLLIMLFFKTRRDAADCVRAFKERSDAVYAAVYEVLGRGYTPGTRTLKDLPVSVAPVHGEDQLIEFKSDGFSMILPLPDADMACHFAAVWETERETLLKVLKEPLSG